MKTKVDLVLRLILGLVLTVFGSNKFLGFMPAPELPEPAANFMGALVQSGYLMGLVGLTEVVAGILLLTGRFVPLALVLLAPVSVNIMAFHLALAPAAIGPALLVSGLNVYLLFAHLPVYRPLLRARA